MKLLFMLRSLVGMAGILVVTLVFSILIIITSFVSSTRRWADAFIQSWGRACCWLIGVRMTCQGLENRPESGCVVLFNHTSFFDIFVLAALFPGLRFGAKIELFKFPFLGAAMRRSGTLPIARHRREEVFRVYQEAKERFASGAQFALAPEGTRQNEERLGAFKAGPFVFAIQSQVPVLPVVIRGAMAIMPKGSLWPTPNSWSNAIEVFVLPAIETKSLNVDERNLLQTQVRQSMLRYISE